MTVGGIDSGTALMGLLTPRAPSNDILNQLIKDKPEFYTFIDIDLSTARTNQVYDEPGTFIWVDNQFARGEVTLRLNELQFGKFDLRRQKYIQGPFFRFFITNVTGQGLIRLFISRGYQAASEPIEAINRAELAARLGYPSFDRRGDVICHDNFEDGIEQFVPIIAGTGASVDWVATRARSKGFSCQLTGGEDGDRWAAIYKLLPYPVSGYMGFEMSFSIDTNTDYLLWEMYLYDGANYLEPQIRINVDGGLALRYLDSLGAPIVLTPTPNILLNSRLFNTIKIVVDYTNKKYVRMMINNLMYDMSDIAVYEGADISAPRVYFGITNKSRALNNDKTYIDDVIATQNES